MRELDPQDLTLRPFHLLDKEWAILVGGADRHNPMTVSWGGFGTLWNRAMVTVYVRPTRFTYELLEVHREFTLNFLDSDARDAMNVCGTRSGRSEDKWQLSGLVQEPAARVQVPRVKGAKLVLECRVAAYSDLDPTQFVDPSIRRLYPLSDYHRIYFGELLFAAERD
jgi:flavin reductase (DIM6/NTAB) family NADH-FMN oxidoreductase RutF